MYKDTKEYARQIYTEIIDEGIRLLTSDGVMYLFCDWAMIEYIQDIAGSHDFRIVSRPLIWTKGSASQDGSAKVTGWRHTYECIVVLQRPDFRPKGIVNDVISHCLPEIQTRSHAAGKPEALYKFLMSQVCDTGDVVLDPCCGGGTVFPAATSLQLRAIGIELNPEFEDHCKEMMMKGIGEVAELEDEDEDTIHRTTGASEDRVAQLGDF
jgi:DNA modification methylase